MEPFTLKSRAKTNVGINQAYRELEIPIAAQRFMASEIVAGGHVAIAQSAKRFSECTAGIVASQVTTVTTRIARRVRITSFSLGVP